VKRQPAARVDPQIKALLVERLRRLRASGELTSEVGLSAAADVGVAERTVWGLGGAGSAATGGRGGSATS
jgi:hypothetical protein